MPRITAQARYWILTIPHAYYIPYRPPGVAYIRGQLESGEQQGYLHWQLLATFERKTRLGGVKSLFGDQCHAEPSRSDAADEYVWKEETRVMGTQFELGERPFKRNNSKDWERVWNHATTGRMADIPADIRVMHYGNLRR